jgi:hypothetical protein
MPTPLSRGIQHAQNMWSLGCIGYQLLTSNGLFDDDSSSSYYRIWKRDREMFRLYNQNLNKHHSKRKLDSCASSFAANFVRDLLTVGNMSTTVTLMDPWIANRVNGKKLPTIDVKFSNLADTPEGSWGEVLISENLLFAPDVSWID